MFKLGVSNNNFITMDCRGISKQRKQKFILLTLSYILCTYLYHVSVFYMPLNVVSHLQNLLSF